jgi:hypothetical protein
MTDLRLLPNLLIAGVAKAGTSSLAWYLTQHPDICPGDRKEINYFSPLVFGLPPRESIEDYARHFSAWAGQTYRLDASPRYFYGGPKLVEAVRSTLPDPKTMIILRDPVDRFWSSYRSKKDRDRLDEGVTFAEFFEACRSRYAEGVDVQKANHRYRSLRIGAYAENLRDWIDGFGSELKIVFFEHLAADPHAVVVDVCEAIGLDPAPAADFDYAVRNVTIPPRSRKLSAVTRRINLRVDRHFRERPELKARLRSAYKTVNGRRQKERMTTEDRALVEAFYAGPNRELQELLSGLGYTDFPAWLAKAAKPIH